MIRQFLISILYIVSATMNLYLFNPENDLALANGDKNYNPPRAIKLMSTELRLLPQWWKDPNDLIFDDNLFYDNFSIDKLYPWGWSPYTVERFKKAGISTSLLPSSQEISSLKVLSHRQSAFVLLDLLRADSYPYVLPLTGHKLSDISEVKQFLRSHPNTVLKTPWSSSGKGLCWPTRITSLNFENWLKTAFKNNEVLLAEPIFDKLQDFGMCFYCDRIQGVTCVGFSLFETDSNGVYKGNHLLSNERIKEILFKSGLQNQLDFLEEAMCKALNQLLLVDQSNTSYPESLSNEDLRLSSVYVENKISNKTSSLRRYAYEGYFGVDMMVYRDHNGFPQVHPCIEINLRMTMGVVSRLLYDQCIKRGSGFFSIDYYSQPELLHQYINQNQIHYQSPDCADFSKKGYYSLIPISSTMHFLPLLQINE